MWTYFSQSHDLSMLVLFHIQSHSSEHISCFLSISSPIHGDLMAGADTVWGPYFLLWIYIFTDIHTEDLNSSLISSIAKYIVSCLYIFVCIKKLSKGFL